MSTVLKIDVDIPEMHKDKTLLQKYVKTRIAIIKALGYTLKRVTYTPTEKGYHFWFTVSENLTDKEMCDLQFLLSDDQARCRFNYLRLEAGCFKQFNVLFNQKLKHKKK